MVRGQRPTVLVRALRQMRQTPDSEMGTDRLAERPTREGRAALLPLRGRVERRAAPGDVFQWRMEGHCAIPRDCRIPFERDLRALAGAEGFFQSATSNGRGKHPLEQ